MASIDELLGEVVDRPPCGPDLTYDAEFLALENALRGKQEQQFGDTVIAAEPPDWRDVEARASALLLRTKDLRLAAMLCHAWTQAQGVIGLSSGIKLIAGLLEKYWDFLHPLPEDDDHFMRMNAVAVLDDVAGLLRDFRQADFLHSSMGIISVREAESIIRGTASEGGNKMSPDQLRVAMHDGQKKNEEVLNAIIEIRAVTKGMQVLFEDKLPSHEHPELDNFLALLNLLASVLHKNEISSTAPENNTEANLDVASAVASMDSNMLRTREDAIAQLLRVAEFLERSEPTNPAPLLIRRSVRLMQMGFIDILRELSPESLPNIEVITGSAQSG